MYDKIEDINKAISSFQGDTVWKSLRSRWDKDFDLYRLKPYNAGPGYYSYTTNKPRLVIDKAIALLNQAKLIIRVPEELLSPEQQDVANNIERFAYGCLNINDDRLVRLECPSLRQQMAWHAVVRGSFFLFVLVNRDDEGNTIPQIEVWDAYNTAYGLGKDGIAWVARTWYCDRDEVSRRFGVEIPTSGTTVDQSMNIATGGSRQVKLVDYYDSEKHGVYANTTWVVPFEEHNVGHTPVFHLVAGSMPSVYHNTYKYSGTHLGESILAPNRNIYPIISKTLSDYITIIRRGVKVPLGYWSAGAQKTLDNDIYQVEKGAVVPMDSTTKEEIKPLMEPSMPKDALPGLQMVSEEEQRGGFPHTVYGSLGFRLSGLAINTLNDVTNTIIEPYMVVLERAYYLTVTELQRQFSKGKFKAIGVRGRTSRNMPFGYPTVDLIKPSDLKGDWYPEVSLEPVYPKDDAQKYYLATMARKPDAYGEPLLSLRTVRQIIGVQDLDLEQELVNSEWANSNAMVRLNRMFVALMGQQRYIEAQYILQEMQRLLAQGAAQQAAKSGGQAESAPSPLEQEAAATPGMGVPSGETGVPSSVMPPEGLGGMPGGAMSASLEGF